MPATYEPIATTTLGSAAATITFSSISSAYTDLRLVVFLLKDSATSTNSLDIRFNSDTGSNYSSTFLRGDGSTADSFRYTSDTNIDCGETTPTTTIGHLITVDIFGYAGSTNKTCLITTSADANGSGQVSRGVGLWRSTSAINTVSMAANFTSGANMGTGTTATLYGILKA